MMHAAPSQATKQEGRIPAEGGELLTTNSIERRPSMMPVRLVAILIIGMSLHGCYTYSHQEEKEADYRFSQLGRELNEAKAEANLMRARRDKYLSDSDFVAAADEDARLVKQQRVVKNIQDQYNQAKTKSLATREGDVKPESPIRGFFSLFKRKD